tara:strand:- start:20 stop:424 length:405 start_codon:yes stop_codon:yes gene_type:complete
MKERITIYTSETCSYCKTVKETLKKEDIEFTEKLILDFKDEWQDISELTGIPTLPTLVFNKEHFIPGRDFLSPEHLVNIIKAYKESKYDYSIRSFERIKSLNFNISSAFNQLQVALNKIEAKLNKEENGNKRNS